MDHRNKLIETRVNREPRMWLGTALLVLSLVLVLLALAGCRGMLLVDNIRDPVRDITARHDAYVSADPELDDITEALYLEQSETLRAKVADTDKDQVAAKDVDQTVERVTNRHDAYIAQDEALPSFDRRIYLRESELLRRVVSEALK